MMTTNLNGNKNPDADDEISAAPGIKILNPFVHKLELENPVDKLKVSKNIKFFFYFVSATFCDLKLKCWI